MIKCHKCGYIYNPKQSTVTLPANFQIAGIPVDAGLPQCPGCKEIDFFGIGEKQDEDASA